MSVIINENYKERNTGRRAEDKAREEMEKRNDLFKMRLILISAMLIAFGTYLGVTMEKRNAEHLRQIRAEYSIGVKK